MLSNVLGLLRSSQARLCLKDSESIYNNLLIISSLQPKEKVLRNLTLESKALLTYLEDQRHLERDGHSRSPVTSLIERGRACEQLIRHVVKRRDRSLFDEHNREEENMKLLQLLERVFSSEEEVTQFLDISKELYCQFLSQYLQNLRTQLSSHREFAQLQAEFMPYIVKDLVDKSQIIFCSLDELPDVLSPGLDFLFIDDAHLVSEVEVYLALRYYPKRVVMAGNFISASQQDKVSNGLFLRSLMKDTHYSMFSRLATLTWLC